MARWLETMAKFSITIQHSPGCLHSNVDGMSRPFCKQCMGKTTKQRWVDRAVEGQKLERADELTEPFGILHVTFAPEILDKDVAELQAEDSDIQPVMDWLQNGDNPTSDDLKCHSPHVNFGT